MPQGGLISIELAFATPIRQELLFLEVPAGTSVAQAIEESSISSLFPSVDLTRLATGIWGRPVDRDYILADGDRIELYRPLAMDPRDARRQLAAQGKSMGKIRRSR